MAFAVKTICILINVFRDTVEQLVEALRYKPGSIPNGVIGIFH
jgi:hypothetical protein